MLILYTMMISVLLIGIMSTTSTTFDFAGRQSRAAARKTDMTETLAGMSQFVRTAYDDYRLRELSGAPCPPAHSRRVQFDGVFLCWPTANNGCVPTGNGYFACPQNLPNFFAQGPANPIAPVHPWALFFPQAQAQSSESVRVTMPNCARSPLENSSCIQCSRAGTTCFSIRFCIKRAPQTFTATDYQCNADEVVTQTFAERVF